MTVYEAQDPLNPLLETSFSFEACLMRELAFIADSFSPQPHPNLNLDLVQVPKNAKNATILISTFLHKIPFQSHSLYVFQYLFISLDFFEFALWQ